MRLSLQNLRLSLIVDTNPLSSQSSLLLADLIGELLHDLVRANLHVALRNDTRSPTHHILLYLALISRRLDLRSWNLDVGVLAFWLFACAIAALLRLFELHDLLFDYLREVCRLLRLLLLLFLLLLRNSRVPFFPGQAAAGALLLALDSFLRFELLLLKLLS